jgi:predicted peroxiredoxin
LISYEENILLQITSKEISCNATMFKTNEGFYIITKTEFEKLKNYNIPKKASDFSLTNELLLANIDFNQKQEAPF